MKIINKKKYREVTLNILKVISTLTENLIDAFVDQKAILHKINNNSDGSNIFSNKLKRMENAGFIEIIENPKSKDKSIKLTNKGRIKLIENSFDNKKDEYWRMISFDIPEKLRNVRNQFRSSIKRIGFKQLQKSLWACPYAKADKVDLIINELRINKYVVYMIVKKTDADLYLKKLFSKEDKK